MTKKSEMIRVPKSILDDRRKFKDIFDVPMTEAFLIKEKLMNGDFKAKRTKRPGKNQKKRWQIEFDI